MDYVLQLFKSVANERRLRIIELLLEKGELSIDEIAKALDIPPASVCRNLKILERAYLVTSRLINGGVLYRLNQPKKHFYSRHIMELVRRRQKERR